MKKGMKPMKFFIIMFSMLILVELAGASARNLKTKINNFSFNDIKIERFINN